MAIIDSISIENETRDIKDKNAPRGETIFRSRPDVGTGFMLLWQSDATMPSNYRSTLQISGDIGHWNGSVKFDVTFTLYSNRDVDTQHCYGFVESSLGLRDSGVDLFFTKTGIGHSDNSTVFRLYAYFTDVGQFIKANLVKPSPTEYAGTIITDETLSNSYQGNLMGKLSNIAMTDMRKTFYSNNYTTPDADTRRFTFSDEIIQTASLYDFYCDVYGVAPKAVAINTTSTPYNNSMTVDFDASDNVSACTLFVRRQGNSYRV